MTTAVPLKRIARFAYGDSLATEDREEGDVPVFGSNGQVGSHTQSNTGQPVVIVGRKGSFGKVQYSDAPVFAIDTTYYIDRTQTSNNIRWLYYLLVATDLGAFSADTGVPGLSREAAYQRLVRWVPIDRQRLIAGFLDRETHRIDALVDAKRRMIELLGEKLGARIDRLVAGSKHGGTDGWRSSTLGRVSRSINDGPFGSSLATKHYTESGVRVIRLGNIGQGHFIPDDEAYVSESYAAELGRYTLDPKDVVMAGLGDEQRSIGRACVVPQEALPAIHKADCYRIVTKQFMDPDYLASYLSSTTGAAQGERLSQGTTRRRVNTEIAARFEVPVPPLEKQRSIVKEVTRVRHLIGAVTSRLNRQLDFLAEYRQALITQAVTGQLDEATLKGDKPVDEAVGVIPE